MFFMLVFNTGTAAHYILEAAFLQTYEVHIFLLVKAGLQTFEVANFGGDEFGWFHIVPSM